jgi:hypothetical protein
MASFLSHLVTQISGSTGGTTYANNQGGMYTRARSKPTNPNSPGQQAVRTNFKNLMNAWTNVLTAAQRAAWQTYNKNTPMMNKLGQMKPIGDNSNYLRSNAPRVQNGLARVDSGPTTFDLGSFTQPTFAITHGTNSMAVTFTVGDSWNVAGGAMFLYASRPQNASINFFKGPFRLVGVISGVATSPQNLVLPFVAGSTSTAMFIKTSVSQADGRLSTDSIVKSTPV